MEVFIWTLLGTAGGCIIGLLIAIMNNLIKLNENMERVISRMDANS